MPFTRITVQEQYETPTGGPAAGSVEFTPVDQMHNGSLVISAPVADTLDASGNLSIDLAATTDPATTPVGVTYRVVERILGQPVRTYYVAVPHDQGEPLQLADLPSYSSGGAAGFALRNAVDYDDGTPPTDGQAIVWDSATSKFHPESVSGVGSTVTSVNGQTGAVTVSPAGIGAQPVDSDLTTIAALAPTDGSLLERVAGAWQARTPVQVKGDLALDLVNNTADLAKPVSTATQTALNAKAPTASPAFTGTVTAPRLVGNLVTVTYAASVTLDASTGSTFRCVATGNLAVTAINSPVQGQEIKLEVQASGGARTVTVNGVASTVASGEWGTWRLSYNQTTTSWVVNDLPAPTGGGSVTSVNGQSGAVTITAAGLGAQLADSDLTDIAALAPADGSLLERVAGVWTARTTTQVKGDLALDQVNNTSDTAKPISNATQTALNLKAPLDSPALTNPTANRFVGAVSSVTFAAALTLNAATASTFQVAATADITSVAITGGSNGQSVRLQVFASGADRVVTAFGVATTVPAGTWGGIGWTYNQSSNVWIQDRTTITGGGAVSSVNGQTGAVTITAASLGAQPVDSDLTTIAALGPTDGSLLSRQGGVWTGRTTAQVKTDMGIDLVDNTSDANKPISNATATSLAAKAPLVSPALSNPTANRFLGAVQVVTYAASVTLDASVATTFRCTATGALTISDITNGANGQSIVLEVFASGADRALTVAGAAITITASQWWIGTLRFDQPIDQWKLTESNGGTAAGSGGGVPADGSVTNAKVAVNAAIDLDKTVDSASRLALTAAERTQLAGLTAALAGKVATSLAVAKGDLLVATSAGTFDRLPVGSTGQVLTVDPATATGLRWATPTTPPTGGFGLVPFGSAAFGG